MSDNFYSLEVKQSTSLLEILLKYFVGNARISIEGDLSQCDLNGIQVLAKFQPDFVVVSGYEDSDIGGVILPVEVSTLDYILRQILPRAGVRKRFFHIKIEKDGKPVFNSNDGFSKDSVLLTAEVGENFVNDLIAKRIIWKYETVEVRSNEKP